MNVKRYAQWRSWENRVHYLLFLIALALLGLGDVGRAGNPLAAVSALAAPDARLVRSIGPGCINLIPNGHFEQIAPAWQIQNSVRAPSYSTEQAFNSVWAMRVGNGLELPNVESISEVRHEPILLPYGATSIILRFVYWPLYESTPGLDLQQADLFNAQTDQLILPLLNVQDDKRDWKAINYDLTAYAGQEISLRFRVRNDGLPGRSLMYVDNVEMEYCAATPIPTYTPSLTPVTTPTPVPTWTLGSTPATLMPATLTTTPFPTTSPTISPVVTYPPPTDNPGPTADPSCPNILVDPDFDGWDGWYFGEDPVPARYVSDVRLNGTYAVQLGNPPGQQADVKSFSSIRQLVTIRADATHAELRWWKYLRTEQPGVAGPLTDRQDVVFLDPALNTLEVPRRELRNDGVWAEDVINLDNYRGRTFYVYFNAFNDGAGARTWMYLDNVQLKVCGSANLGGQQNPVVATSLAIPVTVAATQTQAPLPTLSPVPTQMPTPIPTWTTLATAIPAAVEPTAVAALAPATQTATMQPDSNVNSLPTATSSFVVEVATPDGGIPDSGVTALPPVTIIATPAISVSRPLWMARLGPISVLLGVLVLIGFIVWAILRTFRTERG